jgi:hypothetical protein
MPTRTFPFALRDATQCPPDVVLGLDAPAETLSAAMSVRYRQPLPPMSAMAAYA